MIFGRNEPSPYGSGKKYKKCCSTKQEKFSVLKPAFRMKGGIAFDFKANAFRAIVHTWNNLDCEGEPDEWQSEQVFKSEDDAMYFNKVNIRPELERLQRETAQRKDIDVAIQRLE